MFTAMKLAPMLFSIAHQFRPAFAQSELPILENAAGVRHDMM
jgi:hypothetical protein